MNIGFIIGRFQTYALHDGHKQLIEYAAQECTKLYILVGTRNTPTTDTNPLSYDLRETMLKGYLIDTGWDVSVSVLPLADQMTDAAWSAQLDRTIATIAEGNEVTIYAGRESFQSHYTGRYQKNIEECNFDIDDVSATEMRKNVYDDAYIEFNDTSDIAFRAGVVYAMQTLQHRVYETVDIAMYRKQDDFHEVLMGKKPGETTYRFPGGFVDAGELLKTAARRELREETGLSSEIDPVFINDYLIKDWRIRDTNSVTHRTCLFAVPYTFGKEVAADDLASVEWVRLTVLDVHNTFPDHLPLVNDLMVFIAMLPKVHATRNVVFTDGNVTYPANGC